MWGKLRFGEPDVSDMGNRVGIVNPRDVEFGCSVDAVTRCKLGLGLGGDDVELVEP